MTLARSFTEWGLSLRELPEHVEHAARRHIVDAVGNAIAGRRAGAVDHVVQEALSYTAPATATVFGSSERVPTAMAALANGALIHALDFDDTHAGALIHGSAAVLPAVLAAAQEHDAGLGDVVAAFVAGLEATMRIGRVVPHGFHARGFHATSVVGVFGATLAAARIAGLDEDTAVDALGIAGSQAAGSLQFLDTGSSTKQLHPGLAGMSALLSVRLAERGATGPDSILEGRYGLFQSHLGTEVDVATVLAGLGDEWETTQMTMKPYPVCQLSHATLDAVRPLLPQLAADAIEEIEVHIPPESMPVVAEPAAQKQRPRSTYEAKFSVQWDVAALVVDHRLTIEHFTEEQIHRSDVADLAARVTVAPAPFDGVPADAPGEITVRLKDGRMLNNTVAASSGSPARPMTDAEVLEKFRLNVAGSIDSPEQVGTAILQGAITDADALFSMTEMT